MNSLKHKTITLSLFLKYLCLLSLIGKGGLAIFSLVIPVVSVEKTFDAPGKDSSESVIASNDSVETSRPFKKQGNRWLLQLAGTSPSFKIFSYMPGPSSIRDDRVGLARAAAFLEMLYGVVGTWVFFRLFDAYSKGRVFDFNSLRRLKHIGWWYIGTFPVMLLFAYSKNFWTTGQSISFTINGQLFFGIFIFSIAAVMEEALQMKQDLELTV